MRRTQGFTLVEMLVALAIFGIVVVLATAGIAGGLRVDRYNQAATTTQEKLRRVTEVYTQELRSAVLGGLSNTPYTSNDHQVSFVTLSGSAGNKVLPQSGSSGGSASFPNAHNLRLDWNGSDAAAKALVGQQMLMTNNDGQAVLFTVTNVEQLGDGSYRVVHSHCANTIAYTSPRTMTLTGRSVGFRYDPKTKNLYMKEGTGSEMVMAYDLSSVELQYVYQAADGSIEVLSSPLTGSDGSPLRTATYKGKNVTLMRVGLVLSASGSAAGATVDRTYSGAVEMASAGTVVVDEVAPCK